MLQKVRLGAVLCTLVVTGAACSSNTKQPSTNGAHESSSSAITIASSAPLTSPTYNIPQYKSAMVAAVDSINAAGGVNGHRLSLNVCDTALTVNGEVACAHSIAASKAAAVVGPDFFIDQSGAEWKILQAAKLPVIGSQGGSPIELNSPNVFPLGSGVVGSFIGTASAIVNAGAKRITILIDTTPVGQFATKLITAALQPAGITPVSTVVADATSDPTYATAAAKATAGGVDGAILVGAPTFTVGMIKALKSGGYTGKIATAAILLPPRSIAALQQAADGVILDSVLDFVSDSSNRGVTRFLSDMERYQPGAAKDDVALYAWSSVQLFAQAAAQARDYSAAGLTAAFTSLSRPVDIGTIAPWSVAGKTSPFPGFTRIVNPLITFGTVRGGKSVTDGKGFVNPLTSLAK